MRPARGQADERITRRNARAVDGARFFHDTDRETGEVVLAGDECLGMLGGFAADQRATRLLAACGDALDDGARDLDVEAFANEIVEKEQRLGTLHQDVVDAHRHQVDADGVVLVQRESQLELGADAIGARHQHRLAEAFGQFDERAEATDPRQHLRTQRALSRTA